MLTGPRDRLIEPTTRSQARAEIRAEAKHRRQEGDEAMVTSLAKASLKGCTRRGSSRQTSVGIEAGDEPCRCHRSAASNSRTEARARRRRASWARLARRAISLRRACNPAHSRSRSITTLPSSIALSSSSGASPSTRFSRATSTSRPIARSRRTASGQPRRDDPLRERPGGRGRSPACHRPARPSRRGPRGGHWAQFSAHVEASQQRPVLRRVTPLILPDTLAALADTLNVDRPVSRHGAEYACPHPSLGSSASSSTPGA